MSKELYNLYLYKTDKLVMTGTEEECIAHSKANPESKFYMIKVKEATNATK